jgi:hypothetical protein
LPEPFANSELIVSPTSAISSSSSSSLGGDNFANDDGFGFMGDEQLPLLIPAEVAVVNDAPLVRARMILQNSRQHDKVSFSVGDGVSVDFPVDQRASGDVSRFFCRVISHPRSSYHELNSESGTIRRLFPGGELHPVPSKIADEYKSLISLEGLQRPIFYVAAARQARSGPPPVVTCKCWTGCMAGRCSCMKGNIQCSKHCHGPSQRTCLNSVISLERDSVKLLSLLLLMLDSRSKFFI